MKFLSAKVHIKLRDIGIFTLIYILILFILILTVLGMRNKAARVKTTQCKDFIIKVAVVSFRV